jgi:hypothetical protein
MAREAWDRLLSLVEIVSGQWPAVSNQAVSGVTADLEVTQHQWDAHLGRHGPARTLQPLTADR